MRSVFLAAVAFLLAAGPARAGTAYPLTIENCGHTITFAAAPKRVVSLGQAMTETLFRLGLADRVVGTAVWFGAVLPEYEAANAKIERLANNDPSFEAVIARTPDLVTAQYQWHIGPRGSVGKPEQFAALGIPTYVAPADCVGKDNSGGGDGVRTQPFTLDSIERGIRELAAIFDVNERGAALIQDLRAREAAARAAVAGVPKDLPVLVWFSSRDVKGDPFVAGRSGAAAYILSALGARNVITVNDEWPTVGWESIVATNPALIVVARMDRRRFPADDVAVKLNFLHTDPVVSTMDAVRHNRIVEIDAQALNPGLRTVGGIETLAAGIRAAGLVP